MTELQKPYKKLYRSRTDKKIAGICAGLAVYFNMDPLWMRLLFVLFFLVGGSAFLVYIILWFLIPLEPTTMPPTGDWKP